MAPHAARGGADVAARVSAAVELRDATVERGGRVVVNGVDLTVARGTWFGVIGANGSGKTSLLRALAGRLPLASGKCRIDGVELTHDRTARARRFGFAPPADRLPDALRGRDVLQLVGADIAAIRTHPAPLHQALGLPPLLDRWLGGCSAGMRQRIALAVAFAGEPSLVILDEPFNWLDPVAMFDLRQVLRASVDGGLTLVTALHDLTTLAVACEEGLMLANGGVAMTLDRILLRAAARDPADFERLAIDRLRTGGAAGSTLDR